jgi:uroporphyrinogen-III synthase
VNSGMSGWHIFLTRPEGRNGAVPDRLAVPGLHVHDMPALALRPLIPPQPIPLPHDYDVVVFVSRYAVQQYVALLSQDSADVVPGWPSTTIAATVPCDRPAFHLSASSIRLQIP